MINLGNPTDTLEIVTTGAAATNPAPWTVHWVDILSLDQSVSDIGKTDGVTSGATAVTMVPGPAQGHTRSIKYVSVYNADTTGMQVTVRLNNGTTTRIMISPALATGSTLEYNDN